MDRRLTALMILLAASTIAAVCYLNTSGTNANAPKGPSLRVIFLDEQCGGGAVLVSPEGKCLVIDPGPASTGDRLAAFLKSEGIESVGVLVTNLTPDRMGALPTLIESHGVLRIIHGSPGSDCASWTAYSKRAKQERIPEIELACSDEIGLSKSTRIEALGCAPSGSGEGDDCLVVRAKFGGKRVLFVSDASVESESFLINSGIDISSDVFVVGRNGGYGTTSLEFLSSVRPRVVVVAANSSRGRPSKSVMRRLDPRDTGAELYRTDQGAVEVVTDGTALIAHPREHRRG